jgi:hypothetical protein
MWTDDFVSFPFELHLSYFCLTLEAQPSHFEHRKLTRVLPETAHFHQELEGVPAFKNSSRLTENNPWGMLVFQ